MSNGDSPMAMPWRAAVNPQPQQIAAPMPQAMPMMTLRAPAEGRFKFRVHLPSGRLAIRQEFAHAVERLDNVLGRVGVREPHISLAEDAEVRAADDGDARILQQRRGERLRLPSGA